MNEINPKIANINKISSIEPSIKQKELSQKNKDSFDKILTNQIKKGSNNTVFKETASLPEIEGSLKAQQLNFELNQTQFVQKLTVSLDLLETYASWLQDPDKTLKKAYNILEQASSQIKTLAQEFENNATSNDDLKNILTQLMATIEVEQIKFNRGDYL
ncbi:MAG: hypothetical protein K8S13_20915 [Desulfobacula sp.]|uniref:hypothetical protein n=1 Tax=Desulfobacula sp. TaxID=2593537 RepID=UPI0025C24A6A|nr:hypothetical protein [Desulfobacula sp.]MCD4722295.1 hypothetical protein [Desulfobacula sp.]